MPKRGTAPKWCFWRGKILWCRYTVNGIEVRESLRTSKIEVAAERADKKRKAAVGRLQFGEHVHTWEDVVTAWYGQIGDTVSDSTIVRYDQSIRAVTPYFIDLPITAIGDAEIDKMVTARQHVVGRRKTPVSRATIRRDLTAISSVLSFAISKGWRKGNPAKERAERFKENRFPMSLPAAEDVERVLLPLGRAMEDVARFAWLTGMRQNEIAMLQRRHIKGRTIFIAQAKGDKQRTIEICAEAAAIAARQPASFETQFVFHHDGRPYTCLSTNFSRAVRKAQKAAQRKRVDFTPFRFHDLRHMFAVEELQSGRMGLYELSKHLGHSSVLTTERHYLRHLTPEQQKRAKDGTFHGTRA